MIEKIDFMLILPVIFVSGFVIFLKCEKRYLKIAALIISLIAGVLWGVLEELSTIRASLSFNKIAEHNKAPMALLRDDNDLTVEYLNYAAEVFYHFREKGEKEEDEDYKELDPKVSDLIKRRLERRSPEQIREAVEKMLKAMEKQGEISKEELLAKLKVLPNAPDEGLKDCYLEDLAEYKFDQYEDIIKKLRKQDKKAKNSKKGKITPITLPANLVVGDDSKGVKDKFIITQLTAIPIKQDKKLISKLIDWLGINVKGEEDKQYLGFLLTVMTLDLESCEKATKRKICDRLKLTLSPTPRPTLIN